MRSNDCKVMLGLVSGLMECYVALQIAVYTQNVKQSDDHWLNVHNAAELSRLYTAEAPVFPQVRLNLSKQMEQNLSCSVWPLLEICTEIEL